MIRKYKKHITLKQKKISIFFGNVFEKRSQTHIKDTHKLLEIVVLDFIAETPMDIKQF